MTSSIFPELVAGREDGITPGPWTIQQGGTMRGQASCNISERSIEVPLGSGDRARVVRAHELMHARVSPMPVVLEKAAGEVSVDALMMAEELRVNTLIQRLEFDTEQLTDGTEAPGAKNMAESGDYAGVVRFLPAVMNTGAEKKYLAAVRKERPEWMPLLRAFQKAVRKVIDDTPTAALGSTTLNDDGRPEGFANVTMAIAKMIDTTAGATHAGTTEEARALRRALAPGGRRPPTGQFAELVLAEFEGAPGSGRNSARGDRPANNGTVVRHPERMFTDPHKRVFAKKARVSGGVVVIDQSGSMDIEQGTLEALVRRHPRALVVGYSHRPGDLGTTANAWILAQRGQIAKSISTNNVGNGVDGPVLRWAAAQREGGEPFVWVCDGQVTDSNDHPNEALSQECARLVVQHRIQLVHELSDVDAALTRTGGLPQNLNRFGRIGRALDEARHNPFVVPAVTPFADLSFEVPAPYAGLEL